MNFFKLALILSAFAFFVIACSQTETTNTNSANNSTATAVNTNITNAQPTAPLDELASARKIYSEKCVRCHKENGTGGISDIDGKKIKAPDFTSERMKKDGDADWIEAIENGAKEDGMPAFKGKLSEEEIKDLVKFIRREFQGK